MGRQGDRETSKQGDEGEEVPARLAELYRPGDRVEVYFADTEEWRPGVVAALQPPGVWVRTEEGAVWFVTNGRRIRGRRTRSHHRARHEKMFTEPNPRRLGNPYFVQKDGEK